MTLKQFESRLKTVTPRVYHREADKAAPPYAVWNEYRKVTLSADGKPYVGYWRVQVDYYTKTKIDPAGDAFEAVLSGDDVPFKHTVSFDADTKITRHLFDCEVACGPI